MPLIQKTVYIREEDIEAWNKVSNKAEFIHKSLNPIVLKHKDYSKSDRWKNPSPLEKAEQPVYGIQQSKKTGEVVSGKLAICKQHGIDKNLCRMMKHT